MEILTETTHWGSYVFVLIFLFALILVSLVVITLIITDWAKSEGDASNVIAFVLFLTVGALSCLGINNVVSSGPDVIYKALITDFNDVYEQGYEIVDQDGKIYTLRESEAK